MAIFASSIIGAACSIGESCILGYLRSFPSNLISGWGAGTGFAGVFSNLLYLLTRNLKINDAYLFIFLLLTSILTYWNSFVWLHNQKYRFVN